MAIADKLTQLNNVKLAIKNALINKKVDMTGVPFTNYASKIDEVDSKYIIEFSTVNAGNSSVYRCDVSIFDKTNGNLSKRSIYRTTKTLTVGEITVKVTSNEATVGGSVNITSTKIRKMKMAKYLNNELFIESNWDSTSPINSELNSNTLSFNVDNKMSCIIEIF